MKCSFIETFPKVYVVFTHFRILLFTLLETIITLVTALQLQGLLCLQFYIVMQILCYKIAAQSLNLERLFRKICS